MEKGKKKKLAIIIAIALVVIIGVVITIILVLNKKDAYRIIKVYEVDGVAVVSRDGFDDLDAYNNMVLESGDTVFLKSGSMTLKLDEDKYIYVEENTEFKLVATGDSTNSKTTIDLMQGAVVSEIQNKLSDESTYEVNTPNATMAVRGTVFRSAIANDGELLTYCQVLDGTVYNACLKDGKETKNQMVKKGSQTIIFSNDKDTDFVSSPTEIDYSLFSSETLKILEKVINNGSELSIDEDTIKDLIGETGGNVEPDSFEVVFMYNGSEFGRQTVKNGACPTVPSLMPTEKGSWDYDFTKPPVKDTTIQWIAK